MLFGSSSAEKIHAANTILGHTESREASETLHECVKRDGVMCGRRITVVEMPELYNTSLSQMDVMKEAFEALSLCSFDIHTFILVLGPVGHLTNEDKGELATLIDIFGKDDERFWNRLLILFIFKRNTQENTVIPIISDIKKMNNNYPIKHHIMKKRYDSIEVPELLQEIDAVIASNDCTGYSFSMYMEAQWRRIEKMQKENRELKENKQGGETFEA